MIAPSSELRENFVPLFLHTLLPALYYVVLNIIVFQEIEVSNIFA
jgi:hypothetical protein